MQEPVTNRKYLFQEIFAIVVWFILFGLTVNLGLSHDLLSLYFDESGVIVGGVLLNFLGLIVLAVTHRSWTQDLVAVRQKSIYLLYLILLLAGISTLLHYHWTGLPAVYYLLFTTVSVIWQDYITFGLLQNYLRQYLSFKLTLGLLPILFLLAHFCYISQFAAKSLAVLLTALMAVFFTYLREKTQTLHGLFFCHLLFYFLTA